MSWRVLLASGAVLLIASLARAQSPTPVFTPGTDADTFQFADALTSTPTSPPTETPTATPSPTCGGSVQTVSAYPAICVNFSDTLTQWDTPSNATVLDGANATFFAFPFDVANTTGLYCRAYGLAVPGAASITNIAFTVKGLTANAVWFEGQHGTTPAIRLVKPDAIYSGPVADGPWELSTEAMLPEIPAADRIYDGGLWGGKCNLSATCVPWTPADVNGVFFGTFFSAQVIGPGTTFLGAVDAVQLTVQYCLNAATPTPTITGTPTETSTPTVTQTQNPSFSPIPTATMSPPETPNTDTDVFLFAGATSTPTATVTGTPPTARPTTTPTAVAAADTDTDAFFFIEATITPGGRPSSTPTAGPTGTPNTDADAFFFAAVPTPTIGPATACCDCGPVCTQPTVGACGGGCTVILNAICNTGQ